MFGLIAKTYIAFAYP